MNHQTESLVFFFFYSCHCYSFKCLRHSQTNTKTSSKCSLLASVFCVFKYLLAACKLNTSTKEPSEKRKLQRRHQQFSLGQRSYSAFIVCVKLRGELYKFLHVFPFSLLSFHTYFICMTIFRPYRECRLQSLNFITVESLQTHFTHTQRSSSQMHFNIFSVADRTIHFLLPMKQAHRSR